MNFLDALGGESADDPAIFRAVSDEEGPQLGIGFHEGGPTVISEAATETVARDESSESRKEG